jgi:hypothetical protein
MLKFFKKRSFEKRLEKNLIKLSLITERESFRDNEVKTLRANMLARRSEITSLHEMKIISEAELCRHKETFDIIDKTITNILASNRKRMKQLGKKPQSKTKPLHEVEMK